MDEPRITPSSKPARSVYEDFEIRFVQVYTMMDGTKVTAPRLYALYEQAFDDLQNFRFVPGKNLEDDVSYVTIERRFYPIRNARISEDEADYSISCRPDEF